MLGVAMGECKIIVKHCYARINVMSGRRDRRAIEVLGTVNESGELLIDVPLPFSANCRVKVLVAEDNDAEDDIDLLAAFASDPANKDIFDDSEDIYTLEDGKPFEG